MVEVLVSSLDVMENYQTIHLFALDVEHVLHLMFAQIVQMGGLDPTVSLQDVMD